MFFMGDYHLIKAERMRIRKITIVQSQYNNCFRQGSSIDAKTTGLKIVGEQYIYKTSEYHTSLTTPTSPPVSYV